MRKKKSSKRQIKNRFRWLWPSAVTLFLLVTLVATGYFIFLSPGHIPTPRKVEKTKPLTSQDKIEARAEKAIKIKEINPRKTKKEINYKKKPRLAIIIDDMGEQHYVGRALLEIDLPLSFSFLPFASHTKDLLESAREKGRDILLHLPMEPEDSRWDPGMGALYTSMTPIRIELTAAADLTAVPGVIGVNNHMGSRFTSDREAMAPCLSLIERKGLFFVDSLTSKHSVAWSMAREYNLKTAKRNLFLDNKRDVEEIKKNILALIEIAKQRGHSIGIAHPHQETLDAIRQLKEVLKKDVEVVSVHELVE